jgi:hypothetical protein
MISGKNMQYKIIFRSEKIILSDISKIPKKNIDIIFSKIDILSSL